MPSASKNLMGGNVVPTLVTKLPKGRNVNLGNIVAAGDVVTFAISEPSGDSQGGMVIQVGPGGGTLGAGTFALEVSIDQGVSWAVIPPSATPTLALTGQPGGDAAASFAAVYAISGMGSGATFKFGFVVVPTSGTYPVWGLIG
jgi:hypothetical protein